MKKLIIFLGLVFAVSTQAGDKMRVQYPQLPSLSIETPSDWVVYEQRIFGVEPKNRDIDVAGTVYRASDKSLTEFMQNKHESTLAKMTWYKAVSELSEIKSRSFKGLVREYEGVWPKEKEPTRYVVTTFEVQGYFLSLTFSGLSKKLEPYRSTIKEIYSSIQFEG